MFSYIHCLWTGQSSRGSTVYVSLDKDTGDVLVVIEWVVRWGSTSKKTDPLMMKDAEKYQSQVE